MNPDYRKAEHLAYRILSTFPYPTIPVDIFAIATFYKNLRIKSYSWFAKLNNIAISDVVSFSKSNSGCCFYNATTNKYLILYNDAITSTGHIRWTLGHEFGHFLLKHNEIAKDAVISRNTMVKSQYEVYEKEANCFARSLLAPPNLISVLNLKKSSDVANVFNLSLSAARNILSFISSSNAMGISYSKECELTQNFSSVIWRFFNLKRCNICGYEYKHQYAYCPICKSSEYKYAGDKNMQYSGIKVDDLGRAEECPNCHNTEVYESGHFCVICGCRIINVCSQSTPETQFRPTCTHNDPLPGNARYCPYCGAKTTFFESKFIDSWNGEDDSDDLPF